MNMEKNALRVIRVVVILARMTIELKIEYTLAYVYFY